jgi:hypothetical protein
MAKTVDCHAFHINQRVMMDIRYHRRAWICIGNVGGHFGMFCYVLMFGMFCYVLLRFGMFSDVWYVLGCFGMFSDVLLSVGMFWLFSDVWGCLVTFCYFLGCFRMFC